MRVLVLAGSGVLVELVRRLAPPGTEIGPMGSFDEALAALQADCFDAVIADATHTELPWREFHESCSHHDPPIPVLFESCSSSDLEGLGLSKPVTYSGFLAKPYHIDDLRTELGRLLSSARKLRTTPKSSSEIGHTIAGRRSER